MNCSECGKVLLRAGEGAVGISGCIDAQWCSTECLVEWRKTHEVVIPQQFYYTSKDL
jgi:hypothetical protein